jgi:hypothetical protein
MPVNQHGPKVFTVTITRIKFTPKSFFFLNERETYPEHRDNRTKVCRIELFECEEISGCMVLQRPNQVQRRKIILTLK